MRRAYIDNIKWTTVVLVVFYHVIFMFNANGIEGVVGPVYEKQQQDVFQYVVYPWFMALLFLVAGMNSWTSLQTRSTREFVRSRTVKLLVPSTLGLFAFQWIQGWVNLAISGAFDKMPPDMPGWAKFLIMAESGCAVLWFARSLWLFSIALVFIRHFEKDRLRRRLSNVKHLFIIGGFLLWGGAQILNVPVIICYKFGFYAVAFFLGYFVFSHEKNMETIVKLAPCSLCAAVAFGIYYVVRYYGQNYVETAVFGSILSTFYAWFAIIAILGLAKRYADFSTPLTKWASKKSWGLYVFHYLGVSSCALALCKSGLPPAAIYVITAIAGFGVGYGLYEIISRIPVYRWFVLGIEEKRNNPSASDKRDDALIS